MPNNESFLIPVSRLRKLVGFLGKEVATAMVTTVALSIGFLMFNDYIAPPPNLAGRWKFTVTYQDTSSRKFKDMQVTYQALLIQEGLQLKGTGEKMSAASPTIAFEEYEAQKRINIDLEGTIRRNYFSPDELVIHYKEEGATRASSTLHELEHFDPREMCGCFISTIANTTGPVWWTRVEGRDGLSEPVEMPRSCSSESFSSTC
jgi:hypothetical protein